MSILLFTVLIAYQAIIWGWVPIGIIFLFSLFSTINFKDIGFQRIIFSDFTWLNATVFIVAGVIIILLGYQILIWCRLQQVYARKYF